MNIRGDSYRPKERKKASLLLTVQAAQTDLPPGRGRRAQRKAPGSGAALKQSRWQGGLESGEVSTGDSGKIRPALTHQPPGTWARQRLLGMKAESTNEGTPSHWRLRHVWFRLTALKLSVWNCPAKGRRARSERLPQTRGFLDEDHGLSSKRGPQGIRLRALRSASRCIHRSRFERNVKDSGPELQPRK